MRRLAKLSLLKWEPLDNPGVIKQLCEGERYYFTTGGMCDCGTEIGMAIRMDAALGSREPDLSHELKKLKKKGWSESKIERWIEQTKVVATRRHEEAAARLSGPHPEVDRWIQFVSTVLKEKHAEWVGILVHWYRGGLNTEGINAGNRRWLTLAELTEDYLLNADEDTLHTITMDARPT